MRYIIISTFFLIFNIGSAQQEPMFGIDSLGEIYLDHQPHQSWIERIDTDKIEAIADTIIAQNLWVNAGYVDVDLKQIYQGNQWEDYRLGLGLRTSYLMNPSIQLGARINYGIRDKKFKYALNSSYSINPEKFSKIYATYQDDIIPLGKHGFTEYTFSELYDYRSESTENPYYVKEKKFEIGYETHINQNFSTNFSLSTAKQNILFDYTFKDTNNKKNYTNHTTQISIRYAPKEEYILTKMGKYKTQNGFPIYHFSAVKGWKFFDGEQNFLRLNFTGDWLVNIFPHSTNLTLRAGKIFGEAPLWQYFEGGGKDDFNRSFISRFILGGSQVFETMLPAEFFSSQYAYAMWRQTVFEFNTKPSNIAQVQFLYKIGWGSFDNKDNHNFQFKELDKPYQELGLEINKVIFNLFGLGIYYRIGEYNTGKFSNDFAVKGTFNL